MVNPIGDSLMAKKPTSEQLEQRVKKLIVEIVG
jgi:hypothetical protein